MSDSKKIMAVDDSELNLMMMQSFVEPMGHEIVIATNGKLALELITKENPDIILLDVMMPDMDGFEVCRRLKKDPNTRHIPVILITALDKVEDNVKGIEAGADDFLTKPFDAVILEARMKALLQAKSLHDDISKLERMKEDMTHMIVHDLRTPMSSIKMSLEFLKGQLKDKQQLEMISIASADIEESLLLINNLMDIGKLEANKMEIRREDIILNEIAKETAMRIKPLLMRAGVDIEIRDGGKEVFCEADRVLIGRMLTNLISNAIKFAEAGSKIIIELSENSEATLIGIVNKGQNIPKEFQSVIFEKFGQGRDDKNKAGTGLGLTFCVHVAEAHRGKIWVESPPKAYPSGAAFYMSLPLR